MGLLLRITRYNKASPPAEMEYNWDEVGGTIGRNTSNDWVLPDVKRHLSGKHASIKCQNGNFYVTDNSTNGVYINRNAVPLGRGKTVKLENADVLKMGTYEIEVFLELKAENSSANSSVNSSMNTPIEVMHIGNDNLTSEDDALQVFGLSTDDKNEQGANDKAPLPDWSKSAYSLTDSPNSINPLPDDPFFLDGEFNENAKDETPEREYRQTDSGGLSSFFAPPKVEPQKGGIHNERQELPTDFLATKKPLPLNDQNVGSQNVKSFNKNNSQQSNKTTKKQSINPTGSSFDNQNVEDFLRGAGIRDKKTQQEMIGHLRMEKVGLLFRILLQGSMDVLRTRTKIKNEMHMDVTTIQPVQNNPIKFSVNVDDALQRLFVPQKQAFMPPAQALAETYDDIKAHQIAVISGVQASLKHVLKRFDPENLVDRLQQQNPVSAKIPLQRQARLWSLFEELYSTIEDEAEDDFQRLFGLEFSRAYKEQSALLKSSQGNKND